MKYTIAICTVILGCAGAMLLCIVHLFTSIPAWTLNNIVNAVMLSFMLLLFITFAVAMIRDDIRNLLLKLRKQ